MSSEGNFLTYCIEQYRFEKGLNGREVIGLFKNYKVLDYIYASCEPLHTSKAKYIVDDIDIYIDACKRMEES